MSLPVGISARLTYRPVYGVHLILAAGDTRCLVEIERAPDSGGSPGTPVSLVNDLPGTTRAFFDPIAPDGNDWWYRARHRLPGVLLDGPWTAWVKATALQANAPAVSHQIERSRRLDTIYRSDGVVDADLWGTTNVQGGFLFLPDAYPPQVGQSGAPSSLTKTIRIPHTELVPESDTTKWSIGTYAQPSAINTTVYLYGSIVLPVGVTLTQATLRGHRWSTSDTCEVTFFTLDGNLAATIIGSVAHASTGWANLVINPYRVIGATESLTWQVKLRSATSTTDARAGYVELIYTMPDYAKTL